MLAALLPAVVPAATSAMTLEETVRAALRTNPDVLIARDDVRIAEQETRQARGAYFPSLDLRGATGIEQTRTPSTRLQSSTDPTLWRSESGLTLRQNLFDGFATASDVERAQARQSAAGERVKVSANTVALSAIEAYLEVLRNRRLVQAAENNVSRHGEVVDRARARAGLTSGGPSQPDAAPAVLGRGDTTELPRAEARAAGARSTLEQARGRLRDAEANFVRIVGVRPPADLAPVSVQRGDLPRNDEDALGRAAALSPTIKAATKDIDAATAEIDQADARFLPRFDLELGGNRNKNIDAVTGMSNDASALLVMRYNLYQGGADVARRRGALEKLARARNTLLQTRRSLEQETQLAWNALETARDRLPILSEQLRQSTLAREAYLQQYEVGRKTVIDLLDAEADYYNAASNLVTGELTARFGEYRLLAAVYALFPALGLTDPDIVGSEAGATPR